MVPALFYMTSHNIGNISLTKCVIVVDKVADPMPGAVHKWRHTPMEQRVKDFCDDSP